MFGAPGNLFAIPGASIAEYRATAGRFRRQRRTIPDAVGIQARQTMLFVIRIRRNSEAPAQPPQKQIHFLLAVQFLAKFITRMRISQNHACFIKSGDIFVIVDQLQETRQIFGSFLVLACFGKKPPSYIIRLRLVFIQFQSFDDNSTTRRNVSSGAPRKRDISASIA